MLPPSRVPDPRSAPALRWGVMGPGWIADRFVAALKERTVQQVTAVGSRDLARAAAFAATHAVAHAHGSYADLAADPDVDIVYVATTHPHHHACARLALDAGKHVLVEKPFTVTADEARDLVTTAHANQLFCAEALWSSYSPKYDVIRQLVDDGLLGTVHTVLADYGERFLPAHRGWLPELGGGALFDLGTYPLALALDVLGPVARVSASGADANGVTAQIGIVLADDNGAHAVLHTSILASTPTTAVIAGTEGTVTVAGPFMQPGPMTVAFADGREAWRYDEPRDTYRALSYQAAEAARCITDGRIETPLRPLAASVEMLMIMDEIRRQTAR